MSVRAHFTYRNNNSVIYKFNAGKHCRCVVLMHLQVTFAVILDIYDFID